jgi:prenylcysteine alpha-carboxyl methylesterase
MNIIRILCWTIPIFLWNGFRLFLFVVVLTPAYVRFAWYYGVTSDRLSLAYGNDSIRQTLDLYRPTNRNRHAVVSEADNDIDQEEKECLIDEQTTTTSSASSLSPVIVFYTGGAWIIGYKMWGTLLARALTVAGICVVIPDMRNYPLATVPDMVQDADLSLEWTVKNIADYGGDPSNIVVVGQSAGGHVACMAIFQKLREMFVLRNDDESRTTRTITTSWIPSNLKGLIFISSPFNLSAMQESFVKKGLDNHLVDRIFGHENDKYDPIIAIQEFQNTDYSDRIFQELPPIRIYHGTADQTVPHSSSEAFYTELGKSIKQDEKLGMVSYPEWSHTDPILEGPMDADQTLHRDLFNDVVKFTDDRRDFVWPESDPIIKDRLCPRFLIQAGRVFNPF